MTLYKCPRCGHTTDQKNNLRKHFLRKNPCPNIYANISIDDCFKTILHKDLNIDNHLQGRKEKYKVFKPKLNNHEFYKNVYKNYNNLYKILTKQFKK